MTKSKTNILSLSKAILKSVAIEKSCMPMEADFMITTNILATLDFDILTIEDYENLAKYQFL